jgi:hypothetical protein
VRLRASLAILERQDWSLPAEAERNLDRDLDRDIKEQLLSLGA